MPHDADTQGDVKTSIGEVLDQLPDNETRLIKPSDIRDAVATLAQIAGNPFFVEAALFGARGQGGPLPIVSNYSLAHGSGTRAGRYSFAVGRNSFAAYPDGYDSFAQGFDNNVSENRGFAQGRQNTVTGENSFAQGIGNVVQGENSFAQGSGNSVPNNGSFAQGQSNFISSGLNECFVQGFNNVALVSPAGPAKTGFIFIQGLNNIAGRSTLEQFGHTFIQGFGNYSSNRGRNFIQGEDNFAREGSFVQGSRNNADIYASIFAGSPQNAKGENIFIQGSDNLAGDAGYSDSPKNAFMQGSANKVFSSYSFVQGGQNEAYGIRTFVQGVHGRAPAADQKVWAAGNVEVLEEQTDPGNAQKSRIIKHLKTINEGANDLIVLQMEAGKAYSMKANVICKNIEVGPAESASFVLDQALAFTDPGGSVLINSVGDEVDEFLGNPQAPEFPDESIALNKFVFVSDLELAGASFTCSLVRVGSEIKLIAVADRDGAGAKPFQWCAELEFVEILGATDL